VKPRIGISRCLLGEDVRYDGSNKLSSAVAHLTPFVEWIPVCPEVEVGMGVPREPIQLVRLADGVSSGHEFVRLKGVHTGEDWTERMERWSAARVVDLAAVGISGFVLKPARQAADLSACLCTPTGIRRVRVAAASSPKRWPRTCQVCRSSMKKR